MTHPVNPEPFYGQILDDFGWDEEADFNAAKRLHGLLPSNDTFRYVGTELKHRPIATIVGCGPQLDEVQPHDLQGIVVAADGAAGYLHEIGIIPRIVVTDLDGDMDSLTWAASQGSSLVIHSHGDNIDRLDLVAELGRLACGTYQCTPTDSLAPMRNIGGFTDGDRALMLCRQYGVREARMLAFDFESEPSSWSGNYDAATKPRKLAWARRIIERVEAEDAIQVRFVTPLTAHSA